MNINLNMHANNLHWIQLIWAVPSIDLPGYLEMLRSLQGHAVCKVNVAWSKDISHLHFV